VCEKKSGALVYLCSALAMMSFSSYATTAMYTVIIG
jgi:hypothetical protein